MAVSPVGVYSQVKLHFAIKAIYEAGKLGSLGGKSLREYTDAVGKARDI